MTRINDLFVQGMENMGLDSTKVALSRKEDILILSGEMDTWQQVVDVGHMAAKLPGVTKLVNHLTSKDQPRKPEKDADRWTLQKRISYGGYNSAECRQIKDYFRPFI